MKTILDLCSGNGGWSLPYLENGYDVIRFDIRNGSDIRLLTKLDKQIHGILAAPPCTHFALSGARWWSGKGDGPLLDGLSVVDACLRLVMIHRPVWWCLENPVGRLVHYLGRPETMFDPCDYGDPWTKKTLLWGSFVMPVKSPVAPTEGSKMHRMGESKRRAELRSETPMGFARAFFAANP